MTCVQKGLKKCDYNIDMDMNTMTLPKKGLKKYYYNIDMEKKDLEKLTKDQLIELLLNKEIKKPNVVIIDDTKPTRLNRPPPIQEVVQRIKPTPPPRTGKWENVKPKPVPRNSVKQMVKEYDDRIIQPPEHSGMDTSQSQNQGLMKDHLFKCEDIQNPLERHHLYQSLKLKTT